MEWQDRVAGIETDVEAADEQLKQALEAGTSEDDSFFSDAPAAAQRSANKHVLDGSDVSWSLCVEFFATMDQNIAVFILKCQHPAFETILTSVPRAMIQGRFL